MFGIGPMLPVISAARDIDNHAARKARKRKQKHGHVAGSHELAISRRASTIRTETTLIESSKEGELAASKEVFAEQSPERVSHHQRDLSLTVNWTEEDFKRMAGELKEGVISDLDLSLFAFWIKAKHENYLFAKELVRELALDQGYNVDRVSNARVRKLLQEVHDVRPRDSQRTSTMGSPFQTQTRTPDMRSIGNTRAITSPLTARMESLPPSLRLERERAVQEAARVTMLSSDTADYPPNTPDRPAPLSVRSRGSHASNATPLPNTILRSVSTPIRTQPKGDLIPIPDGRASIVMRDTETLSLASAATAKESISSTGDVFKSLQGRDGGHNNLFTDRLNSSEDRRRGTSDRYMYNNAEDCHHRGIFQLDASDVASESSYGTSSSLVQRNKGRTNNGQVHNSSIMRDDSFEALESYIGTEDENEGSILESASIISKQEICTQYQYAVQAPPTNTIITGPAPTSSQRRATAEAHRKSPAPVYATPAMNFHRPLPLRSYESEAIMFPTAGAQANAGRNRATSVTSIIASRRHATETMPLPPLLGSSQTPNSSASNEQEDYKRDDLHTKISEQVDQYEASVFQRSSSASTLAAFPIPSMDNPVGELPMLIFRATSSSQALHSTPSQQPVALASLEDAYRAITKFHMVATLQRTRDRGKQLQIIEWDKLSSFERAWREMNDLLLVTIYGRKDVVLSETDVAYIDCVARELRSGSNDDAPTDWVRRIFEGNV